MGSISGIGVGGSGAVFAAQYGAKVASLQKDAVEMQGDMALKLIESASIYPQQGLDVRV